MKPPRFAVYLLTRIASGDEALVGDLVERFRQRPSRLWFWRQAIVAIASSTASDIRLHSLVAIRAAGLGCLSVWFFFTQVVVFTQVLGGGGGLDQWLFESGMARWPYLHHYGFASALAGWPSTLFAFAMSGWIVGRTHRRNGPAIVLAYVCVSFGVVVALWFGPLGGISVSRGQPLFPLAHFPVMLVACPSLVLLAGLWAVRPHRRALR